MTSMLSKLKRLLKGREYDQQVHRGTNVRPPDYGVSSVQLKKYIGNDEKLPDNKPCLLGNLTCNAPLTITLKLGNHFQYSRMVEPGPSHPLMDSTPTDERTDSPLTVDMIQMTVVRSTYLRPQREHSFDSESYGKLLALPQEILPARRFASGARFVLISEGDVLLCRLSNSRPVIKKIVNSTCLRKWENHHLVLGNFDLHSTMPSGYMESSIPYHSIKDISVISRCYSDNKSCIRINFNDDCSLLLQTSNCGLRDQWLYSIQWRTSMAKFDDVLKNCTSLYEVPLREFKELVDIALCSVIQDDSIQQYPLDVFSSLLKQHHQQQGDNNKQTDVFKEMASYLAQLLDVYHPTPGICEFFTKHSRNCPPYLHIILSLYKPVILRILKHNMEFGRNPRQQLFIQEYIEAIRSQDNGVQGVLEFVKSAHGPSSSCPHLRVLPNLISVCLAAIHNFYEFKRENRMPSFDSSEDSNKKLTTYLSILQMMSQYSDWRPHMASLLQPIPFPQEALADDFFTLNMRSVLSNISEDGRCEVHTAVLGVRDNRDGWFDLYCPGSIASSDDGQLYAVMLKQLIGCCCRRKAFLQMKLKMAGPWQLLALREDMAAIEALIAVLEYDLCENDEDRMRTVTALQSTTAGNNAYTELCRRQILLAELQQKSGPVRITLPPRSTDADLAEKLRKGSYGNVEFLTLAFTHVTSACAYDLIKLPSLRYLNLWSTQFGDAGLQVLSEHMHRLQVLNLCETPVTDKGLRCLEALKSLQKLNLNSTNLSALTFEKLKEKLPSLKEYDVCYTDAW